MDLLANQSVPNRTGNIPYNKGVNTMITGIESITITDRVVGLIDKNTGMVEQVLQPAIVPCVCCGSHPTYCSCKVPNNWNRTEQNEYGFSYPTWKN